MMPAAPVMTTVLLMTGSPLLRSGENRRLGLDLSPGQPPFRAAADQALSIIPCPGSTAWLRGGSPPTRSAVSASDGFARVSEWLSGRGAGTSDARREAFQATVISRRDRCDGANDWCQRQAKQRDAVTAGRILHHPEHPRSQESAQIANRVDHGDAAGRGGAGQQSGGQRPEDRPTVCWPMTATISAIIITTGWPVPMKTQAAIPPRTAGTHWPRARSARRCGRNASPSRSSPPERPGRARPLTKPIQFGGDPKPLDDQRHEEHQRVAGHALAEIGHGQQPHLRVVRTPRRANTCGLPRAAPARRPAVRLSQARWSGLSHVASARPVGQQYPRHDRT